MPNIFQNLFQSYIESQIKDSLENQNSDDLRSLLSLAKLSKTNQPSSNESASGSLLQFSFKEGKTLLDYSIQKSNSLTNQYRAFPKKSSLYQRLLVGLGLSTPEKLYLLPAQSCIKHLFVLENEISKPLPKQSLGQRFLAWCGRTLSVGFNFTGDPLSLEKVAKEFYEKGIVNVEGIASISKVRKANAPTSSTSEDASISENYTPAEILKSHTLIKRRLAIPKNKTQSKVSNSKRTAPHLQNLLRKAQVTQVTTVDQLHQQLQVQQLNQHLDMEIKDNFAPVQEQVQNYLDNSAKETINSYIYSNLNNKIAFPYWWIEEFCEALARTYPEIGILSYSRTNPSIYISENASKILQAGIKFLDAREFELNQLPLGFFIDREEINENDRKSSIFILKFNAELRATQLKDPLSILRLDPMSVIDSVDKTVQVGKESNPLTADKLKEDFFAELKKQGIDSSALKTVLEHASQRGPWLNFYYKGQVVKRSFQYQTLEPSVYTQFHHILLKSGKEYFLSLMIELEKLSHIPTPEYGRDVYQHRGTFLNLKNTFAVVESPVASSLLDNFLRTYFPDDDPIALAVGNELSQKESLNLLSNLSYPNNSNAQQIFAAIIASDTPILFHKAYQAALTAQNHFKLLNIKITDSLLKFLARDGIEYLNKLINLTTASALPSLQTQLIIADEGPKEVSLSLTFLNQGYSFVVHCMDLDKANILYFHTFNASGWFEKLPTYIDDQYLLNMNLSFLDEAFKYTSNPYFNAWFRYLASQVSPDSVEEAIKKWRSLMGEDSLVIKVENYQRDLENIKAHWGELRDYVLSLPKKVADTELSVQRDKPGLLNEQLELQSRLDTKKAQTYSLEAAKVLCQSTLKLDIKESDFIFKALEQLNNSAGVYKELSRDALLEKAKLLKNPNLKDDPKALIDALAVVRELNYRWTTATSKEKPPKGEWLRMEQVVVILLTLLEPAKLFQVDTSEGKTVIIGISALMQALKGVKSNIYTHNETFADEAFDKIQFLAQALNLKVANKKTSQSDQLNADILCMDISSAVIQNTLNLYEGNSVREAEIDFVDEADNQIDIQAKTTMQISSAVEENSADLKSFLEQLARAYLQLKEETQCNTLEKQIAFIKQALENKFPESSFLQQESLEFWLSAMVGADEKEINKDYIIEEDRVRIVHYTTTGRVDRESIWGEGVHQAVAALAGLKNPKIIIEPLARVVAEGNIASFYKNNKATRYGFTGTLGNSEFSKKTADILGTEKTVIMPRAQRPDLEDANWPLIADGEGSYHKHYNRTYRFAPLVTEDKAQHEDTLLDMIHKIREDNQSGILFFNSIEECEAFSRLLNEREPGHLQIFDDTKPSEENANAIKITQKTAILHASTPGMITLTTAVGGRGVNFNAIDVGIVASPSLERVVDQEAGRIGRNAQFGLVYEVYSLDQLNDSTRKILTQGIIEDAPKELSSKYARANLRFGLDNMEDSTQREDLKLLTAREPLDEFKNKVQKEYAKLKHKDSKVWGAFFSSIQNGENVESLQNKWDKLKEDFQKETPSKEKSDSKRP